MGDSRYRARYLGCDGYALTPCATRTIESLRTYTDGDIMYTGHSDTQADITLDLLQVDLLASGASLFLAVKRPIRREAADRERRSRERSTKDFF